MLYNIYIYTKNYWFQWVLPKEIPERHRPKTLGPWRSCCLVWRDGGNCASTSAGPQVPWDPWEDASGKFIHGRIG